MEGVCGEEMPVGGEWRLRFLVGVGEGVGGRWWFWMWGLKVLGGFCGVVGSFSFSSFGAEGRCCCFEGVVVWRLVSGLVL